MITLSEAQKYALGLLVPEGTYIFWPRGHRPYAAPSGDPVHLATLRNLMARGLVDDDPNKGYWYVRGSKHHITPAGREALDASREKGQGDE